MKVLDFMQRKKCVIAIVWNIFHADGEEVTQSIQFSQVKILPELRMKFFKMKYEDLFKQSGRKASE